MKFKNTTDLTNFKSDVWESQKKRFRRNHVTNVVYMILFGFLAVWSLTSDLGSLPKFLLVAAFGFYTVRYAYRGIGGFLTVMLMDRMLKNARNN